MKVQHSPAPWTLTFKAGAWLVRSAQRAVAQIVAHDAEDEANACVIAVAPELLEALRDMLPLAEAYLRGAPTHPDNARLEDARDAIRKATEPGP